MPKGLFKAFTSLVPSCHASHCSSYTLSTTVNLDTRAFAISNKIESHFRASLHLSCWHQYEKASTRVCAILRKLNIHLSFRIVIFQTFHFALLPQFFCAHIDSISVLDFPFLQTLFAFFDVILMLVSLSVEHHDLKMDNRLFNAV